MGNMGIKELATELRIRAYGVAEKPLHVTVSLPYGGQAVIYQTDKWICKLHAPTLAAVNSVYVDATYYLTKDLQDILGSVDIY